ncbi:cupin domain-containing protein [Desulfoscipio sp. XC116]|uniref:cupin domain-containing protein n=1 Tax=Desulfoscipio sp. XC116 TaxID=3144975 RepID=UPI00325BE92D
MNDKYIKNINHKEALALNNLVECVKGGVVSRTLVQRGDFSLTLFALDRGEGISAYSMPGDTMLHIYDGGVEVVLGESGRFTLQEGQTLVVPADVPHSIDAVEPAKMMIVIVKSQKEGAGKS